MTEFAAVVMYVGAVHIAFTVFASILAAASDELLDTFWNTDESDYTTVEGVIEYIGLIVLSPVLVQLIAVEKAEENVVGGYSG